MTNEVIYIHLIPSLFTLLICLSLGFYAIKIKKYAPENRLLAMICVLMALSSSGVIAGHTLTSATTMTRIFVSLCLIVVPVAIRLAYTLTEKKPPRLFCVVCILCLTIMALIWTGMEPSPLWGWAIFLLGISMIAPSLNPVSDSAPSSGTHLALAGLVVLIFTASLGPFVSYLPDLGFIPVIIFAAGLSYRTPVLRKDLFAYMALALVMVPILDDLIIAISFREEIFKVSTLEWLYSKGSLILISLFFGSVITTLSLRRFGRSARASIFSLTCIIFVTYVLGELLQAILPQHMGQQILAINTPWFAMLPGLIAHLVYQYTSRKKAWIHLFFYFLGLITALAISSGMHLVHTEKTAGNMAIFFFIIPAILFVLVYAVITLKGSLQRQEDPVKKRQLIMLSSGMAMALGFTCIDIISWITAQDLYMINFQFIPLTIVGLGIFYRNLFSGNIYIRRRIVARSIRLIIIIIYLITIPLVFLILKDYTPGYISSCIIPYSIPALISFMVACFLSLFVFGLEQNRTEGILFSLMCFVYAALNLDIVLVNIVPDKALALLISRVDHFFLVLFALGVNLHLAFLVTGKKNTWWLVYLSYAIGLAMCPLTQGRYYLQGMHQYYWGFFAKKAVLYDIMSALWMMALVYSTYLLFTAFRHTKDPRKKTSIKYIFAGFFLAACLSLTNTPAMYGFEIYPLGTFIFIALILIGYGLFKHNMKLAMAHIRAIIEWTGLIAILCIVGFIPRILFGQDMMTAGIFLVIVLYRPIRGVWNTCLNLIIRNQDNDLKKAGQDIMRKIVDIHHLDKMHHILSSWIFANYAVSRTTTLVYRPETQRYEGWTVWNPDASSGLFASRDMQAIEKDRWICIDEDHPLASMGKTRTILTFPALIEWAETNGIDLQKDEILCKAQTICAISSKDRLTGIIVMEHRINGLSYTMNELSVLNDLVLMLAPNIENTMLMEGLEKEVETQTEEINTALIESLVTEKEISQNNMVIKKQNAIFRTLLDTSTQIHQIEDISQLLDFTLSQLTSLFPELGFGIILEDRSKDIIIRASFSGIPDKEKTIIKDNRSILMHEDIDTRVNTIMQKNSISNDDIHWHVMPMRLRGEKTLGKIIIRGKGIDKTTEETITIFIDHISAATQGRLLMQELERLANTDWLTGLYNRTFFEQDISKTIRDAHRFPEIFFSIIMIDINGLKRINDEFGHEKGDELILLVADILKDTCRQSDIVSRIGGDEFAITLHVSHLAQSENLIKRLRKKEKDLTIQCTTNAGKTRSIPVRISIGIAASDEVQPEEVMKLADNRMYADKSEFYKEHNISRREQDGPHRRR